MGGKHRSSPGDQRRRLTRDQDYDVRRIVSPAGREKRKPGTGRALAASDGRFNMQDIERVSLARRGGKV